MGRTVIVSAVRTPFGKMGGALASLSAIQLGSMVIKEAIARAGIDPAIVDNVLMGTVVQAGLGQIPARQAAIAAGLPVTTSALTINKVCASGLRACTLADTFQRGGEGEVFVAGGMESMSNAPYLLKKARFGYRMGNGEIIDSMIHDGLWCAFDDVHMGVHGSTVAKEYGITREAQDAWAARSHQMAHAAYESGRFQEEVMTVEVPQGKGDPLKVARDESIRPDTTAEKLAKLKPAFGADGTITAGNAPGVNDGASALILMSEERAEKLGLKPLAAVISHAMVAERTPYLHTVPALAIQKALAKIGKKVDDIDVFEINEAFAAVTLTSLKLLDADPAKMNVKGGAVAIGHPIGASGGRLVTTLLYELLASKQKYGAAAICSGAAQGDAIILENLQV
ncbi:MAG: acetyl-CoA C-acyltransferase [Cyanobacteria bacterium RYN_339]|nr:acetyl-CoA C-acyltransferase [Cyanobacteria bacterium RYN_339]